jgi:hypothetical protein
MLTLCVRMQVLCGGIRNLSHYKLELLQVYGYEYMFALQNLQKGGLIKANNNPPTKLVRLVGAVGAAAGLSATKATNEQWDSVMKTLNIVPEATSDGFFNDPHDIDLGLTALFGGIVPVTIRLVQKAIFPTKDGWLSLEVLSLSLSLSLSRTRTHAHTHTHTHSYFRQRTAGC